MHCANCARLRAALAAAQLEAGTHLYKRQWDIKTMNRLLDKIDDLIAEREQLLDDLLRSPLHALDNLLQH